MRTLFFLGVLLFGWFGTLLGNLPTYSDDAKHFDEALAYLTISAQVIWIITRRASRNHQTVWFHPRVAKGRRYGAPLALLAISNVIAIATFGEFSPLAQASRAFALASIVYALMSVRTLRASLPRIVVALAALLCTALYLLIVFSGGGRLTILSLAFGLIWTIMPDSRFGRRNIVLLITICGLPFASWVEQARGRESFSVTNIRTSEIDGGLQSVGSPMVEFGVILDEDPNSSGGSVAMIQHRPQSLGRTFLAPAVVLVPRSVWPSKPVGFGRLAVEYYHPDAARAYPTHSIATTYLGEWIYNFGELLGLVAGSSVVGLFIRWSDRVRERLVGEFDSRSTALHTAHILLAVNMVDYVWGGFFVFATRGLFAAAAIVVLANLAPEGRRVSYSQTLNDQRAPARMISRTRAAIPPSTRELISRNEDQLLKDQTTATDRAST